VSARRARLEALTDPAVAVTTSSLTSSAPAGRRCSLQDTPAQVVTSLGEILLRTFPTKSPNDDPASCNRPTQHCPVPSKMVI
jgi:hypothetical protein